jgi:hypothetical protein
MKSGRECAKLKIETQGACHHGTHPEYRQIVDTVFKAVAVGMSVAAIAGRARHGEHSAAGDLLSIGLFCLAVASMKS